MRDEIRELANALPIPPPTRWHPTFSFVMSALTYAFLDAHCPSTYGFNAVVALIFWPYYWAFFMPHWVPIVRHGLSNGLSSLRR